MRLLSTLLTLCLVSIAWGACTTPTLEPTPDYSATITVQVQEQLASIPTAAPLPTYTLYPTFTPYPTLTPPPTATPYPTYTPAPTATLYPTYTPAPTAEPYPTYTPAPTATPEPTPTPRPTATPPAPTWQGSGDWYPDTELEMGLDAVYRDIAPGIEYDVRIATLDADPSRTGNDLFLVLGCVDSIPVGYIYPYDSPFPANMDAYKLGIWDGLNGVWVDQGIDATMTFTDDGGGVYISNRAYLREIVRLLKRASSGLPEEQYLSVILYDSNTAGTADYWSGFNTAGVADTLRYLGCH